MDKKLFSSLDATLREKLKNCRSEAELRKVIAESDGLELNDDLLEGVSGGIDMPELPDERIDCRGFFIS